MENKKKIKILTRGPIRVKGFINGPVLTPYFETFSTIFAMLTVGINIVEVCDDGVEITLTTSNYTEDNSKVAREAREKMNATKEEPKVEENVHEDVVEEVSSEEIDNEVVVEEDKVEEKVEVQKPYYQNNNYKNNKKNKHYNSQVHVEPTSIDLSKK